MIINIKSKENLQYCFKIYGISLIITICLGILSSLFFDKVTTYNEIPTEKQIFTFFSVLFASPILEELIFRYVVIDVSKIKNLIIATCTIFIAMIFSFFKNGDIDRRYLIIYTWAFVFWSFFLLNKKYAVTKFKYFNSIFFIVSAFFFSISHLETYNLKSNDYSYVLTFLGLFIAGLLLNKVRMKAGIIWSMFTHFLMNLIPAIALLYDHFNK